LLDVYRYTAYTHALRTPTPKRERSHLKNRDQCDNYD
jgi:hypothetical protein